MKFKYIGTACKMTLNNKVTVVRQGDIVDVDEAFIQKNPQFEKVIDSNLKVEPTKKGGK